MAFLVQMRQSDKCGRVRNDQKLNLHLESSAGPWVSIPCLLQDTSHISWFYLPKQSTRKKIKNPEMRSNSQQIVLYYLGLYTQNPKLKEVDLEPSPERGSDNINTPKQGRNTQKKASCIKQPALTYRSQHWDKQTWNPLLRKEPIEPEP